MFGDFATMWIQTFRTQTCGQSYYTRQFAITYLPSQSLVLLVITAAVVQCLNREHSLEAQR